MNSNNFIYYQNVRGLKSKSNTFYNNVLTSEYDIYCLTETWLDSTVSSSELFPVGFTVYRLDGKNKCRGSGVLVAVKDDVWHAERLLPHQCDDLELLLVKLSNAKGFSCYLCNVYFPPRSPLERYNSFFSLRITVS